MERFGGPVLALVPVWLSFAGSARGEIYVAGYIGGTKTAAATITLQQSGAISGRIVFRDVPFSGRSFHSPIYYGYRAGFYFKRQFGVEAEFIHLKIYADPDRSVEIAGTV